MPHVMQLLVINDINVGNGHFSAADHLPGAADRAAASCATSVSAQLSFKLSTGGYPLVICDIAIESY